MDEKIKVVQVIDSLDKGGAETVSVDSANNLDKDKFESYICVTRKLGPLQNKLQKNVKLLFLNRKSIIDVKAMLKFIEFLRKEKINIIHSHGSSAFFSNIARRFARKRILHVTTDNYGKDMKKRNSLPYKLILRNLDSVICASNHLKLNWTDKIKFDSDKIVVIPNGIDYSGLLSNRINRSRRGNQIIHCANFKPHKDHRNMIEAARLLKDKGIDFEILVFGKVIDKYYFESVRAEIIRNKLQKNVLLKGFVENPADYLLHSSIGILSSESEALPLSLLEYMGAGLAVIATDAGDCKAVLNKGDFGILIPPRNPRALAEALERLLKDSKLRKSYGRNAMEVALREFDIKSYIKKVEKIYLENEAVWK